MMDTKSRSKEQALGQVLGRAVIVELLASGELLVELTGHSPRRVLCDFLESTTANQIPLSIGDEVLVVPPVDVSQKGCVVGKVGRYREPHTKRVELKADEQLTIRCGKGSITIRETGQILIKGLDVVSHAKRSNRVRGGSIQLN
jgi:hypothetical protein